MDYTLFFLVIVGFLAGMMDAAVGGGGLIQLPGLFNLLPKNTAVASVLSIGKVASFAGTLTATTQYLLKIRIPWKLIIPSLIIAFIFAFLGATFVTYVPVHIIKPVILVILILMAIYIFRKKSFGQIVQQKEFTKKEYWLGVVLTGVIAFYDGAIGPGTGSFLVFVFIKFLSLDFYRAVASTKVINTATNISALIFFIPSGYVIWQWAIPLACANLVGGLIGARLAMKGGSVILRYLFLCSLLFLIGKFSLDIIF